MQLKTILNRVQKFKSFVYTKARWTGSAAEPELEVEVAERANGSALCSGCGCPRPGYDRLRARRFRVCAAVGHQGLSGLRAASGPLGFGQAPPDASLSLVSGALGEAAELERGGRGFS